MAPDKAFPAAFPLLVDLKNMHSGFKLYKYKLQSENQGTISSKQKVFDVPKKKKKNLLHWPSC